MYGNISVIKRMWKTWEKNKNFVVTKKTLMKCDKKSKSLEKKVNKL